MVTQTKPRSGNKFFMRNLVFMVYPVNTCYISLQRQHPEGVSLDLIKGEWAFNGHIAKIGQPLLHSMYPQTGVCVGVFDKTQFKHLEMMLLVEREVATRGYPAGD